MEASGRTVICEEKRSMTQPSSPAAVVPRLAESAMTTVAKNSERISGS
jgi:hypothetical protein